MLRQERGRSWRKESGKGTKIKGKGEE